MAASLFVSTAQRSRAPAAMRRAALDLRLLGRALHQKSLRLLLLSWFGWALARKGGRVVLVIVGFSLGGVEAAALLTAATLLAAAAAGPLGSVSGDRWPPARGLSLGYALQSAALVTSAAVVAVDAGVVWLTVSGALIGASSALTRPVHLAALPDVARHPDELTLGNAASASLDGMASLVGPLVTGLVLVVLGPGWALGLLALVLLASALMARFIVVVQSDRSSERRRVLAELAAGVRVLAADRDASVLVGLISLQYLVVGFLDVVSVVVVVDQLGRDPAATSLLAAAVGAGSALGGLGSVSATRQQSLARVTAWGAIAAGLPLMLVGWASALTLVGGLLVGYGVGKALVTVAGSLLLQRTVPDDVAARVFGVNEGLLNAGTALGAALGPVVLAVVDLRWALVLAGALMPVAVLASTASLRRLDRRSVVPGPVFDLLGAVAFLSLLPLRSLERLARSAIPTSVGDRTPVVTQGEPGDSYFVISRGRARVFVDGVEVRVLEVGDGFGEVALLRATPRTATVRTEGECDLVVLSRDAFLTAVTGTTRALTTADRLVQGWLSDDVSRSFGEQTANEASQPVPSAGSAAKVQSSLPGAGSEREDSMDTPTVADLRASALFDGIDDAALEQITEWFEKRSVDTGEVLAREGASGYAFMLLGSARATVSHGDEVVRELGPGDWFGEGAILGAGRRTATVTAASAGTVWVLFGTRFRELGQRFPEQQALIESVFASRQD